MCQLCKSQKHTKFEIFYKQNKISFHRVTSIEVKMKKAVSNEVFNVLENYWFEGEKKKSVSKK